MKIANDFFKNLFQRFDQDSNIGKFSNNINMNLSNILSGTFKGSRIEFFKGDSQEVLSRISNSLKRVYMKKFLQKSLRVVLQKVLNSFQKLYNEFFQEFLQKHLKEILWDTKPYILKHVIGKYGYSSNLEFFKHSFEDKIWILHQGGI